jgi:hypothetical protein
MHVNTGRRRLREQIPAASGGSPQTQRKRPKFGGSAKLEPIVGISWLSLAGAPKLSGSAQTRRELNSNLWSGFYGRLWREHPNSAGAPKLYGGSAQTWRSAGAPKLCNSADVSMRDPHCKVMLSGRTSHTRVEAISFFVPD